jgi:uncharacterized protein YgbK (DUF1537 family)
VAYKQSAPSQAVDVVRCLNDADYADELFAWVKSQPAGNLAPLVYATTDPTDLSRIQERFGADEASAAVERTFGKLAAMLASEGFDTFIVAGGETSGIVVQSLGVTGFHIGPQIAPGVPWVRAVDRPISLALKSGNFGKERFFFDAQQTIG